MSYLASGMFDQAGQNYCPGMKTLIDQHSENGYDPVCRKFSISNYLVLKEYLCERR